MEDFKEVVYFALSLVMAAFIIILVVTLGVTISQMAATRNGEITAVQNIRTGREFLAYDNQTVTGGDVIAFLRENALTGKLQIYVDKNINGTSLSMNETNYINSSWSFTQLKQSIKADAVYKAILVYGYDSPSSAVYVSNSVSMITGVKFTLS